MTAASAMAQGAATPLTANVAYLDCLIAADGGVSGCEALGEINPGLAERAIKALDGSHWEAGAFGAPTSPLGVSFDVSGAEPMVATVGRGCSRPPAVFTRADIIKEPTARELQAAKAALDRGAEHGLVRLACNIDSGGVPHRCRQTLWAGWRDGRGGDGAGEAVWVSAQRAGRADPRDGDGSD